MHQNLPINSQQPTPSQAQGKAATQASEWTHERVASVAAALDEVPTPAPKLTQAQALAELLPRLKRMRTQGHSLEGICAQLETHGLRVAARTLARHLAAAKRPRRDTPTRQEGAQQATAGQP